MRPLAALLFAALLTACASAGESVGDCTAQRPANGLDCRRRRPRRSARPPFTDGPNGVLIRLEFSAARSAAGLAWPAPPRARRLQRLRRRLPGLGRACRAWTSASSTACSTRVARRPAICRTCLRRRSGVFAAEVFAPLRDARPAHSGVANRRERLSLLDADGSALLIHAGPDDQMSQPIGDAGARIACAAITPLP